MTKPNTQESIISIVLKEMFSAFKVLFQSNSNREFRRLKDFISS